MKPKQYFNSLPKIGIYYEAMKMFYHEGKTAKEVADAFGFSESTIYTMARNLAKKLKEKPDIDPFFSIPKKGRPFKNNISEIEELIISLRKKNLSIPDIKSILDSIPEYEASEGFIHSLLRREGFARLPRRTKLEKSSKQISEVLLADKSEMIRFSNEKFSSSDIGILAFLPLIKKYKIDEAIKNSNYPYSKIINRYSSIMSFIALKLSNIGRYSKDDVWCMDRGMGLFAGLNVLPKATWFSSYSSRVTRDMNIKFLRQMHKIWQEEGLLGDTANIDFTSVPYWGNDEHLENNWSGKRNLSLSSMLAVLIQDPDTGIIGYGDTDVKHANQNEIVLEFIDFYHSNISANKKLNYLVFDSKTTTYANLARIDGNNIKFITIRRRGKKIVNEINEIPSNKWKKIRVECAGNKSRTLKIHDDEVNLIGYGKKIRQIIITGHGKIKPAIIITNDFDENVEIIVRKYARRWLVEKCISEQIEFFHLNRVSSSMVIKVDFDLTMSIAAHNIYRIFVSELERYKNMSDQRAYEEFIKNSGNVEIDGNEIKVFLKKKRNLPSILSLMDSYKNFIYENYGNKHIKFYGASNT